jgi:hypothetical protein
LHSSHDFSSFLALSGLAMAMIDEADTTRKIKKIWLPPKRGQVKDRIFRRFVNSVSKLVLKITQKIDKNK